MGQIYRYSNSKGKDSKSPEIDGLPNYYFSTDSPGQNRALLDSGINPIGKILGIEGLRCPAILIRSSPHKTGNADTPWQDIFDSDYGHIRYYGDNKIRKGDSIRSNDPNERRGNQLLIGQHDTHTSPLKSVRETAVPLLFFQAVRVGNRTKGNLRFHGLGIAERASRIVQFDANSGQTFTNYCFDFLVFDLAKENEEVDWSWITARRNASLTLAATLKFAPTSWRDWIEHGSAFNERYRRRVPKLLTRRKSEQQPNPGTRQHHALLEICSIYNGKEKEFEILAAAVTERILNQGGNSYKTKWITPGSSDGGADFVGRLDVGSSLARTKLVVLGQAKCEDLGTATSGRDIARTVARLKRGWIGVYVTTSHFSEPVQREVIEDQYPLAMVDGGTLAKEVLEMAHEMGGISIRETLTRLHNGNDYPRVHGRRPEEILFEP